MPFPDYPKKLHQYDLSMSPYVSLSLLNSTPSTLSPSNSSLSPNSMYFLTSSFHLTLDYPHRLYPSTSISNLPLSYPFFPPRSPCFKPPQSALLSFLMHPLCPFALCFSTPFLHLHNSSPSLFLRYIPQYTSSSELEVVLQNARPCSVLQPL